jgi:hypothetical protein
MIEILMNYGLWIVLAIVFFAMHRVGMGRCGGQHRRGPIERPQRGLAGRPGIGKASEEEWRTRPAGVRRDHGPGGLS